MRPIGKTFNRGPGGLGAAVAALVLGLLIAAPSANAIPFSTSELTGDKFEQNAVFGPEPMMGFDAIATDGERLAVWEQALTGTRVQILAGNGGDWTPVAQFATNAFGYNSFDIDGDRVLIGDEVWVEESPNDWQLEATLDPDLQGGGGNFPHGGAIEGDTAVISYRNDTLGGGHGHGFPGAAWVFKFDGDDWVQQQKLISSDTGHRGFGDDVDIDDGRIVVGQAHGLSPRNEFWRGTDARAELQAAVSDLAEQCEEGEAADVVPCAAIDTLGGLLVDGLVQVPDGAVYVFTEHPIPAHDSVWLQAARLNAPLRLSFRGATWGDAVAIDGNTIVVGDRHDIGQPTKDPDVVASLVAENLLGDVAENLLEDPEGTLEMYQNDFEQLIIDLYSGPEQELPDGSTARTEEDIEAIVANATSSGSATVFHSLLGDPTTWVPTAKLSSFLTERQSGDFGQDVDVDGERIIIGAPSTQIDREVNPMPGLFNAGGAAYVFERTSALWLPKQVLTPTLEEEVCMQTTGQCFAEGDQYPISVATSVAVGGGNVFTNVGAGLLGFLNASAVHAWDGASAPGEVPLPEELGPIADEINHLLP